MADLRADAASGQLLGCRRRQEDAIVTQFPQGNVPGFAVLSDGMGGHDDGDLAGRLLASEMFGELYLASARATGSQPLPPGALRRALDRSNQRLKHYIDAKCISAEAGGTVIGLCVAGDQLRWISVGDSPLYLFRDGQLQRLNEIHSMAAQLDLMVRNGAMEASAAAEHPHRHCLTSALTGTEISRIDCPAETLALRPGDVVLMASDGLNELDDTEIARIAGRCSRKGSAPLTRALLRAVKRKKTPHQDNVSVVVIRMTPHVVPLRARLRKELLKRFSWMSARILPSRLSGLRPAQRRTEP